MAGIMSAMEMTTTLCDIPVSADSVSRDTASAILLLVAAFLAFASSRASRAQTL